METQDLEMVVMITVLWNLDLLVQEETLLGMTLVMKLVEMVEILDIYLVMMAMIEQKMVAIIHPAFGVEDLAAH